MRRLGRYELVDELGRGGAAIVYLARDTATDRPVALKVLAPHLPRQGDLLARFQHEIKLAVQLEHPHIVPIFDVGVEGDQPYIVLRLLSGGSLADRIQQGPMALLSALDVLKQVASALDAAHQLKIIHRDVKPSNILFDLNGSAYLADFGIAKAIDAVTTPVTSWAVGTPAFMSPEQLRGQAIDARTDEYALGIVAFVMLTGRLPYEGTTAHIITQQLIEPLPDVQRFNPRLPTSFQAVLERATAKDPALRFASAGEFVSALDGAV
jgi:serine/threonine protein kinase